MKRSALKKLRRDRGFTQQEVATMFGVSRSSVRDWELGRRDIPQVFRACYAVFKFGMRKIKPVPLRRKIVEN